MNTDTSKDTIKFSLVMAIHDQTELLRRELPRLLSQEYDSFEVIVIDEHSTEETADVLEQLKAEHPHLYSTFVPQYHSKETPEGLLSLLAQKPLKMSGLYLLMQNLFQHQTHGSPNWQTTARKRIL